MQINELQRRAGIKNFTPGMYFHGTPREFAEFDLQFSAEGHAKEGPGFYFTSDEQDARGYGMKAPGGRIIVATLTVSKPLPLTGRVNPSEVEGLMRKAPNLNDTLMNWDENPNRAFRAAFQSMIQQDTPKDVFEQVWYDFYRNAPAEYLAGMVALGYDGLIFARADNITHVAMFNPKRIHVERIIPL